MKTVTAMKVVDHRNASARRKKEKWLDDWINCLLYRQPTLYTVRMSDGG
jgi:hypothetical protein